MSEMRYSFGPTVRQDELAVSTYAPDTKKVQLSLEGNIIAMQVADNGFWEVSVGLDTLGKMYGFLLDGKGPFPDPGGRFMPEGINGLSQLLTTETYNWEETSWKGLSLDDYIIEEIHIGAFTETGKYRAMEEKLEHLSGLGITAVEIMPVAQFYGSRNWGYDGVYLYSPHYSYGTPFELMHLVDSVHSRGMCAILDVVYNHSGPVGNYLDEFAPFHHMDYRNTWGNCFNLDGEYSDPIREYILQNAIYWLREFRFDALRLDAVHGIIDQSPVHILEEMSHRVSQLEKETGRKIHLIAESDQNDGRLTKTSAGCGKGLDAQWNDDFHHAVHTALTGEHRGYYMDYGEINDICRTMNSGFLYSGQYSKYLKKNRGTPWDNPKGKLVVFSQNHDQIGNRAYGERLITLAGLEKAKLAAFLTILSPFTPLLFMGEEMGTESPFLYFIQTDDRRFAESVYRGRLNEFRHFDWHTGTPDPSLESTFSNSRIKWENLEKSQTLKIMELYRELIGMRKQFVLKNREDIFCRMSGKVLEITFGNEHLALASLDPEAVEFPLSPEEWTVMMDTSWKRYGGTFSPKEIRPHSYSLMPYSGAVFKSRGSVSP